MVDRLLVKRATRANLLRIMAIFCRRSRPKTASKAETTSFATTPALDDVHDGVDAIPEAIEHVGNGRVRQNIVPRILREPPARLVVGQQEEDLAFQLAEIVVRHDEPVAAIDQVMNLG